MTLEEARRYAHNYGVTSWPGTTYWFKRAEYHLQDAERSAHSTDEWERHVRLYWACRLRAEADDQ